MGNFIMAFLVYQIIRVLCLIAVFIMDIVQLQKCSGWASSLESQERYNPAMESISIKGICSWTSKSYIVGFSLDMVLSLYFTHVVWGLASRLRRNPAFLIKFDDRFVARPPIKELGEPS